MPCETRMARKNPFVIEQIVSNPARAEGRLANWQPRSTAAVYVELRIAGHKDRPVRLQRVRKGDTWLRSQAEATSNLTPDDSQRHDLTLAARDRVIQVRRIHPRERHTSLRQHRRLQQPTIARVDHRHVLVPANDDCAAVRVDPSGINRSKVVQTLRLTGTRGEKSPTLEKCSGVARARRSVHPYLRNPVRDPGARHNVHSLHPTEPTSIACHDAHHGAEIRARLFHVLASVPNARTARQSQRTQYPSPSHLEQPD